VVRAFELPKGGRPNASRLVHLHNVSGGVLAGDRLAIDVELEEGTTAQITTTGATRLYRHRGGAAGSEQRSRFFVGDGALLEYLPDAVIPYADSRHAQHTEIHLGRGATLFWWEVLAPGRLAAGESFAFERLHVQTEVSAGSRPILRENFLLEPKQKSPSSVTRMHAYSHMTSFCIAQEGKDAGFWRELEERLNERAQAHTRLGQSVWGASTLTSDGVIVRGLSNSGVSLQGTLIDFWRVARLAVTGEVAVPPRKIY
jgi:urease accessory protein